MFCLSWGNLKRAFSLIMEILKVKVSAQTSLVRLLVVNQATEQDQGYHREAVPAPLFILLVMLSAWTKGCTGESVYPFKGTQLYWCLQFSELTSVSMQQGETKNETMQRLAG